MRLKKFLLPCLGVLLLASVAAGAESEVTSTSSILTTQTRISDDIAALKEAVGRVFADIRLDKADIGLRQGQIDELERTTSEDMAQWGYTDADRELYAQTLSAVDTLYSAYSSLTQIPVEPAVADEELSAFSNVSVDINASDELRREIRKASRELDLQLFQMQSKINKLRLDLEETDHLKKEAEEARAGGTPLARPQLHVLTLESARLNAVLSWYQVQTVKQSYDKSVQRINRLRRRLEGTENEVIFPEATLEANLRQLQDRFDAINNQEGDDALRRLDSANFALVQARTRLGSADILPLTPLSSRYLERQARLNYWENVLAVLTDEAAFLKEAQQVWRSRYQLFHDQASGDEIWKYRDSAQTRIQALQRQMEGVRTMESDVLRRIETLRSYLEDSPAEIQQNITQAIERLQKFLPDIINRYAALIPNLTFLYERLYAEASNKVSAIRIAEKVHSFSKETVMAFLDTELWKGEDYSVTVSKLVIAVAVFLSSFFLSSLGSRWIKRRMLRRARASITAANATQRIVFYILWIAFILIALNIVKIPLTAFAFMGGALAVGIGFGMQNIFNNLISGFIVIFSRPFKVGDIIDVSGTTGTVLDIGSRSTSIKTFDGLDVVLPNRNLLEGTLTNWTGSDAKKREILRVYVAYNADTRHVEDALRKIVTSHSKVLKDPAPFVVLKDFEESAVVFEIYYWFDLRDASGLKISSDMRHYISSLFQEEGIEIPFPQRVIHMAPPQDAGEEK